LEQPAALTLPEPPTTALGASPAFVVELEAFSGPLDLLLHLLDAGESTVREHEVVLEYISRVISSIADAPRAAERSEARRRALRMLPTALSTVVARMARVSGERGLAWFTRECETASQPQVREALSTVIVGMQRDSQGVGKAATERLRNTLEASAAPLRDGVVIRPGTGRGRSSRKIR